jgi:hypothetical protein
MTLYGYDGFDGADFGDMGEDYVQMGDEMGARRKKRKGPRPAAVPAAAPAAAGTRKIAATGRRVPAGRSKAPRMNPRLQASQTNYHPLSLQQMGEEEMGAFQMPNTKTLLMIGGGLAAAWYFFMRK